MKDKMCLSALRKGLLGWGSTGRSGTNYGQKWWQSFGAKPGSGPARVRGLWLMFDSLVLHSHDVLEGGGRRSARNAVCVWSVRRLRKAYANKS